MEGNDSLPDAGNEQAAAPVLTDTEIAILQALQTAEDAIEDRSNAVAELDGYNKEIK
jgi:hypothetical protein